jgi:hypothetical protein
MCKGLIANNLSVFFVPKVNQIQMARSICDSDIGFIALVGNVVINSTTIPSHDHDAPKTEIIDFDNGNCYSFRSLSNFKNIKYFMILHIAFYR